ncbi:Small nuclear ribonucleoprotein G [Spraguea lophii 42_110]|uniref:Small nuclear ribonucleoprotein G n=1 Tax=Spraguea lophii (strain 42_110) TaxID=1358809 RepID=S7W8X5_SPRLO|nr:Small nuclear ribonucleoprotein G [Spraguea lophii 42_110]
MPKEHLKSLENKHIMIHLKKEKTFSGILEEFDDHMNISLKNAIEHAEEDIKLGKVIVNGGFIAFIENME